ncbi:MAG: C40 family peptidase [Paenibacillus macerans]|uniref:NlpC/P60 family protein n=1 Tax=Paenibacillus macerans TaxID=44252 RepID=A0A090ZAX9_PAEMA|nr:C40 family peptidase [Paenibacillus macerans]KFN08434.1 nlpC/P60 family protein [Paenibacillus macerans]MBS5912070.1 C40 family peptidase [Paenibacillus macerans]MCY7557699.1 C40 family peptidase [Paenibacillus macerans]MDU7472538.1 C40 family peptidase [Paenibacillus macerans]MEC0136920.1 C40 family peptidase [Paenibacillus macerans]
MKEIKTRDVVKDIKRLDRFLNVLPRVKRSNGRVKRQVENDKKTSQSPVEYAQRQFAAATKKTTRVQMGVSLRINKRLIRHILKRRLLPEGDSVASDSSLDVNEEPSLTRTPRLALSLHLRKPVDGKYVLSSGSHSGKQRFIRSRVNARLLYRSRTGGFPERMQKRDIGPPKPVGKKETFSAAVSRSANGRVKPLTRVPSTITKHSGHTIKRKVQNFKTLSPFIKNGHLLEHANNHSDAQTEGKMNAVKEAQRATQMAMSARRSIQTARAAARLNRLIVKMVVRATALLVKGLTALLGISGSVIVVLCIVMASAAVISSPFGIFVSGENTDADVKPLSRIVQEIDDEFAARLVDIQQSAGNVDRVEYHYPGSADNTRIDNWMEIIAVFAVKTVTDAENGMDVATLDATRNGIIRSVFWDMNSLESRVETIEHKETVTVEHEDGSTSEETITRHERILHITVTSHTAEQQADTYRFTSEQMELMKEMLSEEFRPLMFAILGKDADIGLTPEQLDLVQQQLPEGELGSEAVKLALTRLGDPYSQPKAGQGNYTDCSYLVQWVYRQLGINLPRTAAEQARFCVENGLTVGAADLVPGDLVFWSYESNGRFMNITHVGIYAGDGKVVDASSSRGQVVYRNLFDSDKQVLFGRPEILDIEAAFNTFN